MTVSSNIEKYVQNSMINGKLVRWTKSVVKVYVAEQPSIAPKYAFLLEKAVRDWNEILVGLGITVRFEFVNEPGSADIAVHWVKVGRVYEGMCKYLSVVNGVINKISIEVGLPNEFSGKETTELSIYCAIMHEFGHALGLGHGVEVDDIMFVPHQKNISKLSENDVYVLKKIYQ